MVTVLGIVTVLDTNLDNLIFVSKVSIPNLNLLECLEVVSGWWVVVSKPILVICLKPKSRLINKINLS